MMRGLLIKKYLLILIVLSVLIIVLSFLFLRDNKFRYLGIEPGGPNPTPPTSIIKLRFNKIISNKDFIKKNVKIKPDNYLLIDVVDNNIVIIPIGGFRENTDYEINIPKVESYAEIIDGMSVLFKTAAIKDDLSSEDSMLDIENYLYQNNLKKYGFMRDTDLVYGKCFKLRSSGFNTTSPTFDLILNPDSLNFNIDNVDKAYLSCFNDFEAYLGKYNFEVKDLNINIKPDWFRPIVENRLGDFDFGH